MSDDGWDPRAGDIVRVVDNWLREDARGVWRVTRDWEGPDHFVMMTRPDRVSGTLNIDRSCVRLVERVEERLARELMEGK